MNPEASLLVRQLLQLRDLHDDGSLPAAAYAEARQRLERQLVDTLLAAPATVAATPLAVPTATGRTGWRLPAAASLAVLLLAGTGYVWQNSASQWLFGRAVPVDSAAGADAAAPHATSADQIEAMVNKLAQRLQGQPEDGPGWAMLGRSYAALGRHADAVTAYEKARPLLGDDARLLVDHADALAMKNGRRVAGEPLALVRRALQIEPDNLKALSLAGTEAFDRQAYTEALQHWERIVRVGPPDDERVQQIAASIAEARRLAGLPPAQAVSSAASPAASPAALAAAGAEPSTASVSGTVTLAPALAASVAATDTVFVFARAVGGPTMPLAILRRTVADLPLSFSLDDSLAMSPGSRMSDVRHVLVGARISRSGQAQPQPGDLVALPLPAKPGDRGLQLQIGSAAKAP